MKHFQPLERCGCGAYRYLAARELGKSYEIVLIHQTADGTRKYLKVAGFPKTTLDFHEARNKGVRDGASLVMALLQTRSDLERVIAIARTRAKGGDPA